MTVEAPAEERAQALQQDLSAGAATSWQVDLNLDLLSQIAGPDGARADIRAQTPLAGNYPEPAITKAGSAVIAASARRAYPDQE